MKEVLGDYTLKVGKNMYTKIGALGDGNYELDILGTHSYRIGKDLFGHIGTGGDAGKNSRNIQIKGNDRLTVGGVSASEISKEASISAASLILIGRTNLALSQTNTLGTVNIDALGKLNTRITGTVNETYSSTLTTAITGAVSPGANVGLNHTDFRVPLAEKYFAVGDVLAFDSRNHFARVQGEPIQVADGWLYTMRLDTGDDTEFVDLSVLVVGAELSCEFSAF